MRGSALVNIFRRLLSLICIAGLAGVYVFQDTAWLKALLPADPALAFIVAKTSRFLLNDILALLLIWSLFPTRGHLLAAVAVQLAGLVFILIPYLILKLHFHAGNGPLVSFLHRLVLNPTLLLLMIPAFYFLDKETDQVG